MTKYDVTKVGIATVAIHKLGNVSRDEPDYCILHSEDENDYYGNWCEGYGFMNIRFPKETTTIASDTLTEKVKKSKVKIV